jgi:glutamyl-tRNA reductase
MKKTKRAMIPILTTTTSTMEKEDLRNTQEDVSTPRNIMMEKEENLIKSQDQDVSNILMEKEENLRNNRKDVQDLRNIIKHQISKFHKFYENM